jgi:pyruvate formate lyase activating enzyme
MDRRPLIVDIKRHSVDDGPGIRSVAFFKGCPLRCVFCHNPETQAHGPELVFRGDLCIGCDACVDACSLRISPGVDAAVRPGCKSCAACAVACPSGALRLAGTYYSPPELMEILLRDEAYYRHSNGGITLSGGECTLYPDYVAALLAPLKAKGIHVVIETCGDFDYAEFAPRVLPYVDLVYFDVKFADPVLHRRYTGRDNRRIVENLTRLIAEVPTRVQPRVPLVPGITNTDENLRAIAELLGRIGARSAVLLPYNPLGRLAAVRLGRACPPIPESFMSAEAMEASHLRFAEFVASSRPFEPGPEPEPHGPA